MLAVLTQARRSGSAVCSVISLLTCQADKTDSKCHRMTEKGEEDAVQDNYVDHCKTTLNMYHRNIWEKRLSVLFSLVG